MTGKNQAKVATVAPADRLRLLRDKLKQENIDGFLVPRADEWQGEYVPARAARLEWLTNFSGSAGIAVVLAAKAAVYSDSRYSLQLQNEVDGAAFDRQTGDDVNTPESWLLANAAPGARIGFDSRLHTVREIARRRKILADKNIELVPVDGNPLDAVWHDQPAHPDAPVVVYPDAMAGKSSADKRADIAATIKKAGATALLLTEPDSIAWLLNIRGGDVPNTPFALSYALLHEDGHLDWFIPPAKVSDDVRRHLGNHVTIHDFPAIKAVLGKASAGKKILMDEAATPVWFESLLKDSGAAVTPHENPVVVRKAQKNDVERAHIRQAHIHDGVALVKFWKWIDETAPKGGLSEIDAVAKLRDLRSAQPGFRDTSFDAIVGWAANGAIVHYRPQAGVCATIGSGSLLLVDSGGQYDGGTTDNTRTRAIGAPTAEMREMFTRVLKGHIAIADARFGDGTTGRDIDMLARQFLRKAGFDYGHGTGHGVGAYLSVHEAGAGISKRFDRPLLPGMLVSNEPGFYKTGEYGIRIENLVFVEETGDDELKYKFNTVSLTPFDRNLIDVDLLDADEIRWLNDYHKAVFDTLSPHLNGDERDWLKKETAPIGRAAAPKP